VKERRRNEESMATACGSLRFVCSINIFVIM
jgi:hypothetical protein